MAPDDLSTPLGLRSGPRPRDVRFYLTLLGSVLVGLPFLVGLVWVAVVDDPNGGEPVAIAPLSNTRTGLGNVAVVGLPSPTDAARAPGMVSRAPPPEAEPRGLSSTPIAALTEKDRHGLIPRIGPDGLRPVDAYARPLGPDDAALPKVVIIVGGIGLSQTGSQEALRLLPGAVTLAFAPYGTDLDRWLARSRDAGHEILLQLPMEPFDFPDNDPGPQTLLTTLQPDVNLDRLHFILSRSSNYTGLVTNMGGRFLMDEAGVTAVATELAARGLLLVDEATAPRSLAPEAARAARTLFTRADIVIDAAATEQAIDARLVQLEELARSRGIAVGTASALPISIRRIAEWAKGLSARGVALVPVSAAVKAGEG